ncbi:arylamine N-acetyltransferase [Arcobacter sp. LA11]|uniref:arylamine N-acetyltransferase family protein n=1 Tax=Arcobacter sp. LA11 TaxID=1898176 RepID=UPI000934C3E5|nr:arylamine N-acetyltransferase [Arcobacter sp. LA11]
MDKDKIVNGYLSALDIDNKISNIEDITKLIKAHLRTFPFSSMKVLLKEDISLELKDIYENIVVRKRGGYCYEHNKLFYEVLKNLGFEVEYYLARVVNNTDSIVPQTHRFTVLNFEDKRYLIDVGIGFRSPTSPVKFGKEVSSCLLGTYCIKEFDDKTFAMQLIQNDKPFIVTKFDLNKCYEVDFTLGHFYSHKNPEAVFVNNLVVSLMDNDAIYSLVNKNYLKIYKDKTEKIEINSLEQFQEILEHDLNSNFNLDEVVFLYEKYIEE